MFAGISYGGFQDKSLIFLWFQVSNDNDDGELFLFNAWRTKGVMPYF